MKGVIFLMLLITGSIKVQGQYITRSGHISFNSKTPLEDIKGDNCQVYANIDISKKTLSFALLMKSFLFRKELMQQHFNENYVESDKYPKASFTGEFAGDVDLDKNGVYPVRAKGHLTLHGVTRYIDVPGALEVKSGRLSGTSSFKIRPADYAIRIPAVVKDKIAEQVDVFVKVEFNLSN